MQSHADSGWAIAIYAAAVALLLVMATFRLDGILARRKKVQDPRTLSGRRFQDPDSRLMDPHGNGLSRGSAQADGRRRPRILP